MKKRLVGKAQVFAVSDLHVNFQPNMEWVQSLHSREFNLDVLIVAGDVSDGFTKLRSV